MAKNKYKHNDLMKILTILGGLVGLASAILVLANYDLPATFSAVDRVISAIVGIVIAALTLLCAMRPDDPIPWHWLILFILAILLFVFSGLWGGVLVILAALIGLFDDVF
jgi:ABC-type polysaccharide/polyol phosphate export permease